MKLLAIESSGLVASAAVMDDAVLLAEYTVNFKKTHSQTLLPMVEEVVRMLGLDLEELDAIAVAGGPGSFTGLRIGSATAKGLGLALGKPIVAVPTTQAIAANVFGFSGLVCPLMDARRDQVYTGLYRYTQEGFFVVCDQMAVSVEELVEKVNELGEAVLYLGDGVEPYLDVLQKQTRVPMSFAPPHCARQRAGALAVRAMQLYREGRTETALAHVPDYLRLSQAEREYALRTGNPKADGDSHAEAASSRNALRTADPKANGDSHAQEAASSRNALRTGGSHAAD